ncbi:NUDIX domain protein [Boeremia exigua]|uniref:NUDIX domain protein n=1 Tax=Boeremia exigua TaxID=749465 RepID=UPI001E8EC824|nr:NUDIX domain protein [Boeremia exigua]KAH6639271.1 NUDIX domain protein [Boeremia exigua]
MPEQSIYNFKYDPSVAEFAISKSAYLEAHPREPFDLIATSALVVHKSTTSEPRVLILQRAASDSNPNKWEPPGGAVDDDDVSILHAAARELWEEAGLRAARISGPIGEPHFFARSNGDRVCRFNFVVHVASQGSDVPITKLDYKEHQKEVWATESEIHAGRTRDIELEFVNEEVKRTILLAYDYPRTT